MDSLLLAPELLTGDGGIVRMLRLYLKALCELSKEGDTVRLVSLNDRDWDSAVLRNYSNPSLVGIEACNKSRRRFVMGALRWGARSNRIVCGHVAQLPVAWAASRFGRRAPYFLVAHGIEVWRPFSLMERIALKQASRVWCVSEFTRDRLLGYCTLPSGRTAVLPNALDPFLDPPAPATAAAGPPLVLSISRLSIADDYKGIGHLIAAMPAVRSEIPDARLRIVGRGDGLPGLQALAKRLNLAESVEFAGYVGDSELSREFARCRLFALPSQKEGFGLVYLEAMAHGRPCLGARSGGTPEVISGETGVLVEFGDVPGIARAIVAAVRRDWRPEPMLERARMFSYQRFRERLAGLLADQGSS
jgi:glycosyltransferase involved in cell wall biosynthesis